MVFQFTAPPDTTFREAGAQFVVPRFLFWQDWQES